MKEVHLLGFPVRLYVRAQEHHAELMREFALLALAPNAAPSPIVLEPAPRRLLALASELASRYSGANPAADQARQDALHRGDTVVDLQLAVDERAGPALQKFDLLLDEADDYCRAERLLTLETPPDLVTFRRWYLRQLVCQLEGEPPQAWSGPVD